MFDDRPTDERPVVSDRRRGHISFGAVAGACGAVAGVAGILAMVFVPRSEWAKHTEVQAGVQVEMRTSIDSLKSTARENTEALKDLTEELTKLRITVGAMTRRRE